MHSSIKTYQSNSILNNKREFHVINNKRLSPEQIIVGSEIHFDYSDIKGNKTRRKVKRLKMLKNCA